jgi:hypothetical protein
MRHRRQPSSQVGPVYQDSAFDRARLYVVSVLLLQWPRAVRIAAHAAESKTRHETKAPMTFLRQITLHCPVCDDAQATYWFDRVPHAVVDFKAQEYILAAAGRQAEEPGEWLS